MSQMSAHHFVKRRDALTVRAQVGLMDPLPVPQRRHLLPGLAIPHGSQGIVVDREHEAPISAQLDRHRVVLVKGNAALRSAVPQRQLISGAPGEQGHHVPVERG